MRGAYLSLPMVFVLPMRLLIALHCCDLAENMTQVEYLVVLLDYLLYQYHLWSTNISLTSVSSISIG